MIAPRASTRFDCCGGAATWETKSRAPQISAAAPYMAGMLKLSVPLLIGLSVAVLAACSKPEPQAAGQRPQGPLRHVQVLQGDAIVIDGRHLRLANAVTPARMPQARCWAEALAGREARRRTGELTANAGDVLIDPTGAKDEYAREIARVSIDGVDLGEALIAEGMAVRPRAPAFDWCGRVSTQVTDGPNVSALADLGK